MTHRERKSCRLADLGMITALGSGLEATWPRLLAGDASRLSPRADLISGESRLFGAVLDPLPEIPDSLSRYACRNNRLSLAAYESIQASVERAIRAFGSGRVGIVAGSSTAGMAETEDAMRNWVETGHLTRSFDLVQMEYGGVAQFIQRISGATGPCYSLSTACSTGAKVLVAARSLLDLGMCDAVIVGAADSLCRLTANGFFSLQAISAGVPNPMSRWRDGLVLGEGAAWFLMTRESGGIQLLGAGETSDAYHMSAPDPQGRGAEACMRAALDEAAIPPSSLAYLNLHGTATPQNDAMESLAVDRVLGLSVPCSSTKPLVGHTLGASGAIEAAFCWLVLSHREGSRLLLPPHRFDGDRDGDLPRLTLVGDGQSAEVDAEPAVMSNSFGFGGSNCSLVMGSLAS